MSFSIKFSSLSSQQLQQLYTLFKGICRRTIDDSPELSSFFGSLSHALAREHRIRRDRRSEDEILMEEWEFELTRMDSPTLRAAGNFFRRIQSRFEDDHPAMADFSNRFATLLESAYRERPARTKLDSESFTIPNIG